jgi:ABC-type phosphate/phosphonate transport system substrate-binding protein
MAVLLLGLWQPLAAQPVSTSPTLVADKELFRIGYLRRQGTEHWGEEQLEVLRRALNDDSEIRRELDRAGYGRIGLFPADGPADMVRRLNAREFDLAFTPANIYADQQADYSVILKARRAEDTPFVTDTSYGALRKGVVFVSPRQTALFGKGGLSREAVADALSQERIAVVSTQSVAGFHAPILDLYETYGQRSLQSGYIFFDSSEEVVKGVLSGLANVGACELGALNRVLEENGLEEQRGELLFVLLETNPVVTDPVLWLNRTPPNFTLRRLVQLKIPPLSKEENLGGIQYVPSNNDEYRKLISLLAKFNSIGEVTQ